MFRHLFLNKLKVLLRNKPMLFWSLIFPFVLGTFFQLALSNVGDAYEMEVIPLAVVENNFYYENDSLKSMISVLSESGENQLFKTSYVSVEEASKLLEEGVVDGYIILENSDTSELVVRENGINQTIIKGVIDEYYQTTSVVNQVIVYDPELIYSGILELVYENPEFVKDNSVENVDFSINYFFTLIAMTCLYGSLIGLEVIKDSEANLSTKGARINVAPVSKMKIISSGLLAGYFIQLVAIAMLFAYLIFVFKVNFGQQVLPTIILAMVGCLAGTSLGIFVGVSNKKSESFKIGLLIAVIMSCCFFSGMMGVQTIKVYFDETFPVFAKINPVNIITDGLYSLFAYDTLEVYYNCLMRISIFSLVLLVLTFVFVRRKNYDSI